MVSHSLFLVVAAMPATLAAAHPHLFFLLADDLGFAELNFERDVPSADVHTPHIDALATDGLRLARRTTRRLEVARAICSRLISRVLKFAHPLIRVR